MFAGNKIYGGKILQQSEPNRKIFFGHRKNLQNCFFSVEIFIGNRLENESSIIFQKFLKIYC